MVDRERWFEDKRHALLAVAMQQLVVTGQPTITVVPGIWLQHS